LVSQIWTVGHSTRTIDIFISVLEENGIKLVADVRSFPGSRRYPQFNRKMLAKSLAEYGIRYEHFPELGGRRKAGEDSHNTAWRNASFRGYADHMETEEFRKGIERLLDLANKLGPAAIMCAEAVWWRCHRALISDYLKTGGLEVMHILDANKRGAASVHIRGANCKWRIKLCGVVQGAAAFQLAPQGPLESAPSLVSEESVTRPRKRLMPAGFAPCAVCDVSRHRRRELLAFHHSLSQPVKPLGARLSV